VIVYPGDLEFGGGAALCIEALAAMKGEQAILVMACRAKTARAHEAETTLRRKSDALGVSHRLHWVGETPRIHALLGAAVVVALPSRDWDAKRGYPLVLLDAMSVGRPVGVATGTAAAELAQDGAALALQACADTLAASFESLLQDTQRAEALGGRAARVVRRDYAPRVMAKGYEAVYDRLLLGS
jgi:glycosyltransferase involved in cell wall biosynthesis